MKKKSHLHDVYIIAEDKIFEYTITRQKGYDFEDMLKTFEAFKIKHSINKEMKLKRVSRKNYLNICMWQDYKTLPEWNYPDHRVF